MALIPRYDQRRTTPLGGVDGGIRAVTMPSIGEGIQSIGRGAEAAAVDMQQRKAAEEREAARLEAERQKAQDEQDDAWFVGVSAQPTLQIVQGLGELRARTPDTGQGYSAATLQLVNSAYQTLEAQATTPRARARVATAKASALESFGSAAIKEEQETRTAWIKSQADQGLNSALALIDQTPENLLDEVATQQAGALTSALAGADLDPKTRLERSSAILSAIADRKEARRATLTAARTGRLPDFAVPGGPVPDAVRGAAQRAGLDPDLAIAVLMLENPRMDPDARPVRGGKRLSSAHGLFQIIDETWEGLGGGDRGSVERQIVNGLKNLVQTRDALRGALRREPTGAEVYLGHQQGEAGAKALLTADPGTRAVDAIAGFYASRADALKAIVNNGGKADSTVGEFLAMWNAKYARAEAAARGDSLSRFVTPKGREEAIKAGEKEIKARSDLLINQLDIAISRGGAGAPQIDQAVREGWLDPASADYARLTKAADAEAERVREAAAQAVRIDQALKLGIGLDPTSADDRKAVDADYERRMGQWTPEQWGEESVRYAARLGVLPDMLGGRVVGALRSADPNNRLTGAQLYGSLRAANPGLIEGLPADVKADANFLLEYQRKGMKPQEAVEALRTAERLGADELKARDQAFMQGLGAKRAGATRMLAELVLQDRTVKDEKGFWGPDFTPPAEMLEDFVSVARANYRRMGDSEAAMRAAYDQIRRTWAPSAFNGGRTFMRNAPEAVFGIPSLTAGENAKWMQEQARADAGIPKGDLRVIEAPGLLSRDGRPVYYLMTESGGVMKPVADKVGRVRPWRPDWSASPEKRRLDAAARKREADALARARGDRDALDAAAESGEDLMPIMPGGA